MLRIGTAPRGLVRVTKIEKMQKLPERTLSPGPGAYNPVVRMKPGGKPGAKYTFASRYYKKPRKKSPGPGRYKPRFI